MTEGPLFVLVHGAWHGAWCYTRLQTELALLGHRSIAVDLPGNGVEARIPESFWADPFDPGRLSTQPSASAGVTHGDQADAVNATISQLRERGEHDIVLAGHSMGGHVITNVGERIAEQLSQLVYITAFMPASGVPAVAYIQSEENEGEQVGPLFRADPETVGALRINPGSAADQPAIIEAFAGTVAPEHHGAILHLLSTDLPIQVPTKATATTSDRWGSIRRTYVRCQRDQAILPATQDRMIAEADAFTPGNPTSVATMDTCHSPFLADPAGLAAVLAAAVS
jgi:pimeloyl-ACP methyl ester carboxylesterase